MLYPFVQLSLLLKNDPLVTELRLFDVRLAPGVAADISHVNTPAIVRIVWTILETQADVFSLVF